MIYISAFLYVHKGSEKVFDLYESAVLPILSDYGGKLLHRIRTEKENSYSFEGELPYEVHLLVFPSKKEFDAYLGDERRSAYENLLKDSIKTTFVIKEEK